MQACIWREVGQTLEKMASSGGQWDHHPWGFWRLHICPDLELWVGWLWGLTGDHRGGVSYTVPLHMWLCFSSQTSRSLVSARHHLFSSFHFPRQFQRWDIDLVSLASISFKPVYRASALGECSDIQCKGCILRHSREVCNLQTLTELRRNICTWCISIAWPSCWALQIFSCMCSGGTHNCSGRQKRFEKKSG